MGAALRVDEMMDRIDRLDPIRKRQALELIAADKEVQPHTAYQSDPVGWMVDMLGIPENTIRWSLNPGYDKHTWDGTPDPLVAIAESLARFEDTGAESGTGTGKSYEAACLILWFLACFQGARAFTFAPKEDQLRLYIWAEIAKLWPVFQRHFPTAALSDLRIRMDGTDSWGAWGYAVGVRADEEVATKAAGMHAKYMMLVYEETPGIPLPVMAAGENTCTGPYNVRLALGNPDNQQDALHQFCIGAGVNHVRISALDHPNVVSGDADLVPGAVSLTSISRRRMKYGEGSPLYESRIRGISPEQATDALVRGEWLDRAAARYLEQHGQHGPRHGVRSKGVDVANSENGDKAAIADGIDNALIRLRSLPCPNANKLGEQVVLEMRLDGVAQEHVGIDPVGVGAGTVNEAARLGVVARRLNGASRPTAKAEKAPDGSSMEWVADSNLFKNLRSQMHWQFREDLRLDRLAIAPEIVKQYKSQFTLPTYEIKNGFVVVESKDDLKARSGGKSPDEMDAVIYWNWVRPRKASERAHTAEEVRDKAPQFDYQQKKLVRPIDMDSEPDNVRPNRRFTRAVRMPRVRA